MKYFDWLLRILFDDVTGDHLRLGASLCVVHGVLYSALSALGFGWVLATVFSLVGCFFGFQARLSSLFSEGCSWVYVLRVLSLVCVFVLGTLLSYLV